MHPFLTLSLPFPHTLSQDHEAKLATMTTALRAATQRVEELMEELLQSRARVAQLEALGREAADSERLRNQLAQVWRGAVCCASRCQVDAVRSRSRNGERRMCQDAGFCQVAKHRH